MSNMECYIVEEDPRYPILVIQGSFGSAGYALNPNTLSLRRVCICSAISSSECVCGYDEDNLQLGLHGDS